MKQYEEEFGEIDLPREACCGSCGSHNVNEKYLSTCNKWYMFCSDCGFRGPEHKDLFQAILLWNDAVAGTTSEKVHR